MKQSQESGDNSTNIQARSVVLHQGLSYVDARQIALDVFKDNFIQVKAEAAAIANQRAEEITEQILAKIVERNPATIAEFQQPGVQDAVYTVQKEYAKSGEKELGDLLVDILTDRVAQPKRNMLQIVLDESLRIAPKLTVEQLDKLTLSFILIRTKRLTIKTFEDLKQYFNNVVAIFTENLTNENADYSHIEYIGGGVVRAGNYGPLENRLREVYKAFFSAGFTEEEFAAEIGNIEDFRWALIPCFHDSTKLQLNFYDDVVLQKMCAERDVTEANIAKLKAFFEKTTKPSNEVKDLISAICPPMERIFNVWSTSSFWSLELTSVGIAIAHANYRRRTGETLDLSIWIK